MRDLFQDRVAGKAQNLLVPWVNREQCLPVEPGRKKVLDETTRVVPTL